MLQKTYSSNKDIIVWRTRSHNFQDLHSLRTFEVQRSGIYFLIPSLSPGGSVQEEKRNAVQLDNGLILQLKNSKTTGFGNFFHGILEGIAGTIKWAAILLIVLVVIIANRRKIMQTLRPKKNLEKSSIEQQPYHHAASKFRQDLRPTDKDK